MDKSMVVLGFVPVGSGAFRCQQAPSGNGLKVVNDFKVFTGRKNSIDKKTLTVL